MHTLVAASEDEAPLSVRDDRMQEMERRMRAITVQCGGQPVALVGKPILRFDDAVRAFHDGTIWAFGTTGRPVALGTLERYEDFWSYELVSLSNDVLSARIMAGVKWMPAPPGLEWQRFSDAPAPADSVVRRLFQMKQLVRRLSLAERLPDGNQVVLRLMPKQVHRYTAPDVGLRDGAFFIFSHGTNPEAVAVIECRDSGSEGPTWSVAATRLTSAELTVKLDGREILKMPGSFGVPSLQEPYIFFRQP